MTLLRGLPEIVGKAVGLTNSLIKKVRLSAVIDCAGILYALTVRYRFLSLAGIFS